MLTVQTGASVRRLLADYVLAVADWRCMQMRRYPHDARQARAADGLLTLARHVAELPETDSRPRRVVRAGQVGPHGFSPSPSVDDAAVHFRLDDPDEACDAFLSRLARLARDDQPGDIEIAAEHAQIDEISTAALRIMGHDPERALELLVRRLERARPEDEALRAHSRAQLARSIERAMPRAWLEDGRAG
jgi:hypothetical protein